MFIILPCKLNIEAWSSDFLIFNFGEGGLIGWQTAIGRKNDWR
jgi:hypothetical protein